MNKCFFLNPISSWHCKTKKQEISMICFQVIKNFVISKMNQLSRYFYRNTLYLFTTSFEKLISWVIAFAFNNPVSKTNRISIIYRSRINKHKFISNFQLLICFIKLNTRHYFYFLFPKEIFYSFFTHSAIIHNQTNTCKEVLA